MRVYIAAPYALRDRLREFHLPALEYPGHVCTSSWLTETLPITQATTGAASSVSDAQAEAHVEQDIADVRSSDALVLVTWQQACTISSIPARYPNSGGRHVETGVALALGLPVIVWGPEPENIFHRGADAHLAPTWRAVLDTLADLMEEAS